MTTVTKIFTFDACHHLPHYDGACNKQHGHTYKLEVTVTGKVDRDITNPKCGMIIDFKDLKKIVDDTVISNHDHSKLNDFFENPTAEMMMEKIDSGYAEFTPFVKIYNDAYVKSTTTGSETGLRSAT